MSTVTVVPERADGELSGADAARTVERTDTRRLVVDAIARLRGADGTSHARSLAWAISLIWFQALVGMLVTRTTACGQVERAANRVSVVLWLAVTIGFSIFLANSDQFSQAYGPVAGVVAAGVVVPQLARRAVRVGARRPDGGRSPRHRAAHAPVTTWAAPARRDEGGARRPRPVDQRCPSIRWPSRWCRP